MAVLERKHPSSKVRQGNMADNLFIPATLPKCGIFRTTKPLPGQVENVPANRLIYFHNHSQQGDPMLLLPKENTNNRWGWQERGFLIKDAAFPGSLAPLLPEGIYILKATFTYDGKTIPEKALVQVGYNQAAEPILFMGRWDGNSILFPNKGIKAPNTSVFRDLEVPSFLVGRSAQQQENEMH
jgi:hypothetical protein